MKNEKLCAGKRRNSAWRQRVFMLFIVFAVCLTGMALAKNRKAPATSAKNRKAAVVFAKKGKAVRKAKMPSAKMRARKRAVLLDKLAGIAVKLGVPPDGIELTRYAIKHPIYFSSVVGHAMAMDIPFFALVGAVKAAKNKNFPGIGAFTQAKCELPIAVIDIVFGKADAFIDDAKGKQDTNIVTGVAKEYAAQYAKEQSAAVKEQLIAEMTQAIPYFAEIKTICSFAFETNLQAERDIQKIVSKKAQQFQRAYKAFADGNYADGVAALLELGADPSIACDFVDSAVSSGLLGRLPVLSNLVRGVCKNFVGKVFDGIKGIVKGGIDYVEAGVKAVVDLGKDVGCAVYSLIGDGCSSAPPPDLATQAINAAKSWCAARGGLEGFLSRVPGQDVAFTCIDKSACRQRPGEPMRCATAEEKAAWDAQRASILQANLKDKLGDEILEINKRWSPLCPTGASKCGMDIGLVAYQALQKIQAAAKTDPYGDYFLIKYFPLQEANAKAEQIVRDAEFSILPQKWAKDYTDRWMLRCGVNKKCADHITFTRNFILTAVSAYHKQKPAAPHSAVSALYADVETTASDFFKKIIDRGFYHAKGDIPDAAQRTFWEQKIKQDAATYEIVLKNVSDEMNKNPAVRRLMIQTAYVTAMGRMPTDGDMNYWLPRGENFRDIIEASRNWLYSPNGAADLNAAVTSVLQFYLKRPPTQNEVSNSVGEYKKNPKRLIFMEMRGTMPKIYY
ncbi:MAG: hypothetical protein M3209_08625 [Acidobacteriota bacterium]|nr:hypothetical protein [Acidobacteriota bacterium]